LNKRSFELLEHTNPAVDIKDVLYLNDNPQSAISRAGKLIKPTETRVLTVMASELQTLNFLNALEVNRMNKPGNAIVCGE
jgi:hypothetical protein